MPDRLSGLRRYMWPERGTAQAGCMAHDTNCPFLAENIDYAAACAKARAHTRETGHDTRVYHRRVVEYSADDG